MHKERSKTSSVTADEPAAERAGITKNQLAAAFKILRAFGICKPAHPAPPLPNLQSAGGSCTELHGGGAGK